MMKTLFFTIVFGVSTASTQVLAFDANDVERLKTTPHEDMSYSEFCLATGILVGQIHNKIRKGLPKAAIVEYYTTPQEDWSSLKGEFGKEMIEAAELRISIRDPMDVFEDVETQCLKSIYESTTR